MNHTFEKCVNAEKLVGGPPTSGHRFIYVGMFCSCGSVFHFCPLDTIILEHGLLLCPSSWVWKLMISCQFSGTMWMSCFFTEKLLKDFWLTSPLWPAWEHKLFSVLAASGLFRGRARSGLVWGWFSFPSDTGAWHWDSLGDDSGCTLTESRLNVRLSTESLLCFVSTTFFFFFF